MSLHSQYYRVVNKTSNKIDVLDLLTDREQKFLIGVGLPSRNNKCKVTYKRLASEYDLSGTSVQDLFLLCGGRRELTSIIREVRVS